MNKLFFFLVVGCLLSACGSKKVLSPKESEGPQLVLSHGGGFTGAYKTFFVLDNGQVFKNTDMAGNCNALNGLDIEVVKQIFSNYTTLGLDKIEMKSVGNLNYSIMLRDEEGDHKIVWEKGQAGAEKLQLFYRNVMNHIRMNNDMKGNKNKPRRDAKF